MMCPRVAARVGRRHLPYGLTTVEGSESSSKAQYDLNKSDYIRRYYYLAYRIV